MTELLKGDEGLTINDFIVSVHHKADRAEKHVAFQGDVPEYVTMPPKLRAAADNLGLARDAAAGGDKDKKAIMLAQWSDLKQAIRINAQHISMLSQHRKDPSILHNAGYEVKESTPSKPAALHLLELVPEVSVKHDVAPESIIITVKRPKNNASVGIQMTYGDPNQEASWGAQPEGVHNKSRIVQKGLEQARRIYLRARYHEDGSTGRWSQPVSIIVL